MILNYEVLHFDVHSKVSLFAVNVIRNTWAQRVRKKYSACGCEGRCYIVTVVPEMVRAIPQFCTPLPYTSTLRSDSVLNSHAALSKSIVRSNVSSCIQYGKFIKISLFHRLTQSLSHSYSHCPLHFILPAHFLHLKFAPVLHTVFK